MSFWTVESHIYKAFYKTRYIKYPISSKISPHDILQIQSWAQRAQLFTWQTEKLLFKDHIIPIIFPSLWAIESRDAISQMAHQIISSDKSFERHQSPALDPKPTFWQTHHQQTRHFRYSLKRCNYLVRISTYGCIRASTRLPIFWVCEQKFSSYRQTGFEFLWRNTQQRGKHINEWKNSKVILLSRKTKTTWQVIRACP